MAIEIKFILSLVAAFIAINFYTTWLIARSFSFTKRQKGAQTAIVWAVPFFGAVLVWIFLRSDGKNKLFDPWAVVDRNEYGVNLQQDVATHGD
jgi:hypothetical protein